jgi:hypothetical protein
LPSEVVVVVGLVGVDVDVVDMKRRKDKTTK